MLPRIAGFMRRIPSPGQTRGVAGSAAVRAGCVGELISSSIATGSAVSLTSGVAANITTITLTPGAWIVIAAPTFKGGATTVIKYILACVSEVSATLDSTSGRRFDFTFGDPSTGLAAFSVGNTPALGIPPIPFNVAVNTPIYLVAQPEFATSTCSAFGTLRAIRIA